MINLLITAFGVALIIGGFYAMSFGFSSPPNLPFFIIGLCISVFGAILFIFFGSKVDLSNLKITAPQMRGHKKEVASKNSGKNIKPTTMPKNVERPEPPKKIEPVTKKPEKKPKIKRLVTSKKTEDSAKEKEPKPIVPKKIEPKRVPKEEKEANTTKSNLEKLAAKHKAASKKEEPPVSKTSPKPSEEKEKKDKPKFTMGKKVEPVKSSSRNDDEFVKNRLDRLKENYIKNAKDIENLIEERLDSFKGTLDQIKSESKDPSIIWSFDAGDVQNTMKDTILKADKRILMMYPWVRNIDVGILKRFMETESRMIIQEASLDDDASVELIRLLMDNNVKIKTMPHVHTVAIVSDEENGLIISTDPIYESFEVGVIYKDQKSIEEIERMFEEAWNLSKDIEFEINQ